MSTSKKVTRRRKPITNGHYRIPEKAQEKIDQKKKPRPKKKVRPTKKKMYA